MVVQSEALEESGEQHWWADEPVSWSKNFWGNRKMKNIEIEEEAGMGEVRAAHGEVSEKRGVSDDEE
ncbi:uncharacterized protein MONOS_9055 [Monocercomonoides exilis]|uniref:uncharacterized protein n=1 Tax=Monocercomonoides exilis TaxID=2049356 RepID=UPI003559FD16|nr:hypothetical protein MONOS_9055 [Monocercomonoides exilis]|eukprot:MONOS_9055.1-p1 / transcript=MONOS_9055.1 / gene=MONOS_9055 / organism=Monocercomonoides_exilis_PA203 / gene_product=unspecified product / transcript_product=unspecified product / location=Mono_scaffold00360:52993-53193(+) / protein_length=67 / sequence_SO=supercontig / SO=protein_coding / is_pseudo=false